MSPDKFASLFSSYSSPQVFGFAERKMRIDRTKAGLIILMIGVILGSIILIPLVGSVLIIVGTILIIRGREAFGKLHSRHVLWSIGIFIGGIVISVATLGVFYIQLNIITATPSNFSIDAVVSIFNGLLIGGVISAALSGTAFTLLTYTLQKPTGRNLLFSTYALNLAINIAIALLVASQVGPAIDASISRGTFDPTPLEDLVAMIETLSYLGLIPASMFALAYYMAWLRINKGEIPGATAITTPNPSTV